MNCNTTRSPRSLACVVAAAALLISAGCAKHKDFPSPLALIAPPTPANLVITDDTGGKYTMTWGVDDPAIVDHYNIYSVSSFGAALEGTTTDTEFGVDLLIPVGGVVLGVSAVTVENVEGAMVTAVTPDP